MSHFTDVDRSADINKAYSESQDKTPAHKHAVIHSSGGEDGTGDDDGRPDEHTRTSAETVYGGANKWNRACTP